MGARLFKLLPGVSSIRRVLVAGFAVLLAVWVFAGYELLRSLADVEQRVTAEHKAFARAADAVSVIRGSVLEASINVRDALIDADAAARESYRDELRGFRETSEQQVLKYVPQAQSVAERNEWTKLQSKLGEFWTSIDPSSRLLRISDSASAASA